MANSWGQTVDKRSFEDRKAFVQEHLELVLDSAERPFEGQRCAPLRHPLNYLLTEVHVSCTGPPLIVSCPLPLAWPAVSVLF